MFGLYVGLLVETIATMSSDICDEKSFLHRDNTATIFDPWADYVKGDNLFSNNGESRWRRMQEEKKKLFSQEDKMQVDIINILGKF